MKICIIGAGFTGLALGYFLTKDGHSVDIFEQSDHLGGLASGIKVGDWFVDRFYHHIFSSDTDIQKLAKDVGFDSWIWKKSNTTSTYYNDTIYPFSSSTDLLRFYPLPLLDRLRTGLVSLSLKLKKSQSGFESITAETWLTKYMGKPSFKVIWKPLLVKKFSDRYYHNIIMSWFWARIYKRTFSLGYPSGGFESLAEAIAIEIKKQGGNIFLNNRVTLVNDLLPIYDRVVYTGPNRLFTKITNNLPDAYLDQAGAGISLSAMTMVLEYNGEILKPNYWININDLSMKSLVCAVNQTGFIHRKHYDDKQIIYLGGYFHPQDKFFRADNKAITKIWLEYLQKLTPNINKNQITKVHIFKADNAQPVMNRDYPRNILPFKTPIANLFLVNIDQIYPYDRGVNYAVVWAKKALPIILR
jgi:protoporphyrinogen oxidase